MSQIELILSRHGETEENKLHIMQGQLPGHLSELGKQQAKALAETLDKEELDVIVCSDLARSYDTAMAERIAAGGDSSSSRNGLGHIYRESSG